MGKPRTSKVWIPAKLHAKIEAHAKRIGVTTDQFATVLLYVWMLQHGIPFNQSRGA